MSTQAPADKTGGRYAHFWAENPIGKITRNSKKNNDTIIFDVYDLVEQEEIFTELLDRSAIRIRNNEVLGAFFEDCADALLNKITRRVIEYGLNLTPVDFYETRYAHLCYMSKQLNEKRDKAAVIGLSQLRNFVDCLCFCMRDMKFDDRDIWFLRSKIYDLNINALSGSFIVDKQRWVKEDMEHGDIDFEGVRGLMREKGGCNSYTYQIAKQEEQTDALISKAKDEKRLFEKSNRDSSVQK